MQVELKNREENSEYKKLIFFCCYFYIFILFTSKLFLKEIN